MITCGGYKDETLIIWDLVHYQAISSIKGVYCCDANSIKNIDGNHIIVGGFNELFIVNINTFSIDVTLVDARLNSIICFTQLKDGNFLCGCSDGIICLYDINDNEINDIREHSLENEIQCIEQKNNEIYFGGRGFSLKKLSYKK